MTYNKTIRVDTNWLDAIDGLDVRQAIKFLQTLDQDSILNCTLEGDTHGCSIEAYLSYEVPMSNKEILAYLENHYGRQIADREKGKQYYIYKGQLDRVPQSDKLIAELQAKLGEARAKYK